MERRRGSIRSGESSEGGTFGASRAVNRVHLLALGLLLLGVGIGKIGTELYRWHTTAEERIELQRLAMEIEEAGLEVIRSQVEATRRMAEIRQMDRSLRLFRGSISRQERRAIRGRIPDAVYDDYQYSLDSYNGSVDARNRRMEEWREVVAKNQMDVERYNALADSIRSIASLLGEPYFPIPTPAEVAVRHGFVPDGGPLAPSARSSTPE